MAVFGERDGRVHKIAGIEDEVEQLGENVLYEQSRSYQVSSSGGETMEQGGTTGGKTHVFGKSGTVHSG